MSPCPGSVLYVDALAPRYGGGDLSGSVRRTSHDHFWQPDQDHLEDEPESSEAGDELAIIGVARQVRSGRAGTDP